jgi:hypothetical protein
MLPKKVFDTAGFIQILLFFHTQIFGPTLEPAILQMKKFMLFKRVRKPLNAAS